MRLPGNFNRTPKIVRSDRVTSSNTEPGKVGVRNCCECKIRPATKDEHCTKCLSKLRSKFDREFNRGRQ